MYFQELALILIFTPLQALLALESRGCRLFIIFAVLFLMAPLRPFEPRIVSFTSANVHLQGFNSHNFDFLSKRTICIANQGSGTNIGILAKMK